MVSLSMPEAAVLWELDRATFNNIVMEGRRVAMDQGCQGLVLGPNYIPQESSGNETSLGLGHEVSGEDIICHMIYMYIYIYMYHICTYKMDFRLYGVL